jgi:hypothetical protein
MFYGVYFFHFTLISLFIVFVLFIHLGSTNKLSKIVKESVGGTLNDYYKFVKTEVTSQKNLSYFNFLFFLFFLITTYY